MIRRDDTTEYGETQYPNDIITIIIVVIARDIFFFDRRNVALLNN